MKKFFEFYHELDKNREFSPVCEFRANWNWGERWKRGGVKVRGGVNPATIADRLEKLEDESPVFGLLKLAQMISMDYPSVEPSMLPVMGQLFDLNYSFASSLIDLMKKGMGNLDLVVEFLDLVENTYERISQEGGKVLRALDQNLRGRELDEASLLQIEKDLQSLSIWMAEGMQRLKDEASEFRSTINLKNWRN